MNFFQILPSLLSILSTIIIGLAGWGFRSTLSEIKTSIKKNAEEIDKVDRRHTEKVQKLEDNFNDLKADLPLVYTLREDFVRTMNNVENRIVGMDSKLDKVLEKMPKGGSDHG